MSQGVPHSAFCDWKVDFNLWNIPIHCAAKFGVSKPVIIIDSCVVKSWFTFANPQSVSLKLPRSKIVFYILFCIWMTIFSYSSMSTCRQNKHTQRHLVEAKNGVIQVCVINRWQHYHIDIRDFSSPGSYLTCNRSPTDGTPSVVGIWQAGYTSSCFCQVLDGSVI